MKILANDLPRKHWLRIAASNGISRRCFDMRVARGSSLQQAATTPINAKYRLRQCDPSSARQAALRAGLNETAVIQYRQRNPETPLTNPQIAAKLAARRVQIESGASLNAKAKAAGLCLTTVQKRIKRGLSLQQALTQPRMTPRQAGEQRWQAKNTTNSVK